ncbi:LppX_LprAFG lipoprotein [Chloroflexales bacterium ZM16-3]|nr:LppX_LprAFG lipoprotein [Chloroflexales bacterium ZM16-3]
MVGMLSACGGAAQPTPTPAPTPTPRELSVAVGRATQAAESVHFAITLAGAPVFADAANIFALNSMEGDLKRPDSVLAVLSVSAGGGVAEIRTVALDGKQYITSPITREWTCLAPGSTFNPAVLFDPQQGVEHLLQEGFDEVSLVGVEDLAGRPSYHLRGTISGEKLQPISMGLLGAGPVAVDLWADQETMRASKLVLVDTSSDAASPSTWTITFSDYGKTIDVRAPADC